MRISSPLHTLLCVTVFLILNNRDVAGAALVNPADYQCHGTALGNLDLYWTVDEPNGFINIGFTGKTSGWIGVGFDAGKKMVGADIIMGSVQSGTVAFFQGKAHSNNKPDAFNGDAIAIDYTVENANGLTSLKFKRKIAPTAADTVDLTNKLDGVSIIFAYAGSPDISRQHSSTASGSINFRGCSLSAGSNKAQQNHGILMLISWGFLVPLAIIIARFFKWIGHLWYQLHFGLLLIACGLSIAGVAIIINDAGGSIDAGDKTVLAHAVIGLIGFGLMLMQPFIGFYADYVYDPKRNEIPFWPDKVHWIFGRTSYLLATVAVCIGLKLISGNAAWYISYIVVTGIFILTWIGLSAKYGANPAHEVEMQPKAPGA